MRWSIGKQITLLVALGAFGTLVLCAFAWFQVDAVYQAANFANINTVPSLRDLGDAQSALSTIDNDLWARLSTQDASAATALESRIGEDEAAARAALDRYRKEDMDEPETLFVPDKAAWDASQAALDAYVGMKNKVITLLHAQDAAGARALMLDSRELQSRFVATLAGQRKLNMDFAAHASIDAEATFRYVRLLIAGFGLLAVLVAGALGVYIRRSIVGSIETAVAAAQSIASGDLTTRIVVQGQAEMERLLHALEEMQSNLASIVRGVRVNSDGVAIASSQIAQGNQDLSGRTEQQASALEETTATMEEFRATIRQNAENARQANQLALAAREVASRGGSAVDQMVETMRKINESSGHIAEIIGVINGIAFQTNILALNAAVEAARAGEQGRGFAVVAGEVRALAQRSAQAAQEIKTLITESVARAQQGSGLADQTGSTMTEVLDSIRRVTDIVSEIAAASDEQQRGVSQIGDAVAQIDQTTQQNAALVEQSAAAAASLKGQAHDLVRSVSTFKIAERAA
jgi:methyl-accepting chemotaxis protein